MSYFNNRNSGRRYSPMSSNSYNNSLVNSSYSSNYGNTGPRWKSTYRDPADYGNYGGKHRKTKGKKSRKMKGGVWSWDTPPPTMSETQDSLTTSRRRQSGGSGTYSDGASYGMYVNGTGGSQWTRTMDQAGPYGGVPGNTIIGAQGQNIQPTGQMPSQNNLALIQKAGGKRRKGGFLGEVINQAIVPLSLLGMQQTYRRKKGGKRGTRKNRKNRKH